MTETNTPEMTPELEAELQQAEIPVGDIPEEVPEDSETPAEKIPYTPKKRRRRWGDRRDGRLLHDIPAMPKLMPYIMVDLIYLVKILVIILKILN